MSELHWGKSTESEKRATSCERTHTEKGRELQVTKFCEEFNSCVHLWHKHANKLEGLLSDSECCRSREERDSLIAAIDDVDKAYSQMKSKPYPQSYSRASFSRQNRNKCSLVMPVYVSHIDSPDIESIVYAMLDTVWYYFYFGRYMQGILSDRYSCQVTIIYDVCRKSSCQFSQGQGTICAWF